jgi:hypothetical protein
MAVEEKLFTLSFSFNIKRPQIISKIIMAGGWVKKLILL